MAMGSQFCLAETVGLGNDQKCQLHKNLQGWDMDLNLQSSGLKKRATKGASVFPYAARYGSFEFQVLRAVKPEKAAMFTRMASRNTRPRGLETETMRMMEAID